MIDDSDAGFSPSGVWESSSFDRGWIPYGGQQTITFKLPRGFPGSYTLQAWVSTAPDQTDAGGVFVEAAGQLAEFQNVVPGSFQVLNDSCASYYLYVVATATATGPAPVDAGADAPHD